MPQKPSIFVGFLGCEISAQDIFCRYLRRRALVCCSFTPNDRLQSHKLRQPVKPFVVVGGAVALIILIRQLTVTISAVMLGLHNRQFMNDSCVFYFARALLPARPFVVAGAI